MISTQEQQLQCRSIWFWLWQQNASRWESYALYGHRGSPRYWKEALAEAASDLGLKPSKIDNSLYMDTGNFIQYVHADDELLSGDDRLVRDMVQKLKQKFLVKKVDYLSKVGDKIQILGRTAERTRL